MERDNKFPSLISTEGFWVDALLENKIQLLRKLAQNTITKQAYLMSVLNLEKKNVSFKRKKQTEI